MRPLTGRELDEQHKALCEVGPDLPTERLRWLSREVDLWIEDLPDAGEAPNAE